MNKSSKDLKWWLLLFLTAMLFSLARADWGPIIRVSNFDEDNNYAEAITVAPNGTVHVFWQRYTNGNKWLYYDRSLDGENFDGNVFIDNVGGIWNLDRVHALVTEDTIIHAFLEVSYNGTRLWYWRSMDNGLTWVEQSQIMNNIYSINVTSHDDVIYVMWVNDEDSVFLKKSIDNGDSWNTVFVMKCTQPIISLLVTENKIHLVWAVNMKTWYKYSEDDGENWSGSYLVQDSFLYITSLIEKGEQLYVFNYKGMPDYQYYYRLFTGDGFDSPVVVDYGHLEGYSNGKWIGVYMYRFYYDPDSVWSSSEILYCESENLVDWSTLWISNNTDTATANHSTGIATDGDGNVYSAWTENSKPHDNGRKYVFFRKNTIDSKIEEGMESNNINSKLKVYPTIVSNMVFIDTDSNVDLYDKCGRLIRKSVKGLIDVKDLSNGTYFVVGKNKVGKFVKVR